MPARTENKAALYWENSFSIAFASAKNFTAGNIQEESALKHIVDQ